MPWVWCILVVDLLCVDERKGFEFGEMMMMTMKRKNARQVVVAEFHLFLVPFSTRHAVS